MISHIHHCIFVHIPKVAGQSIESVFVEANNLTWETRAPLLLRPNHDKSMGPPRLAHLMANEYLSHGYVNQSDFEQYFKFSFVRNPWDRLVSEFNYRQSHGEQNYQGSFKDFLFHSFPTPESDNYANAKDYYRHVIPQWKFLYDENDNCLVDFIGKFEDLQQDFNQVLSHLNLPEKLLPHKNTTFSNSTSIKSKLYSLFKGKITKRHYSQYYDQESMEFVANLYQKDIALFNYQFKHS